MGKTEGTEAITTPESKSTTPESKSTTPQATSTTPKTDTTSTNGGSNKDIDVGNYGIFDHGVSDVKDICDKYSQGKSDLDGFCSVLKEGSVFMGPVCDSCVEGFKKVDGKIDLDTYNFNEIGKYFKTTSATYQKGDDDASATVLTLGDDGKLEAIPLSKYVGSGQVVYYNQKGWYDEYGNLHRWDTTWGKDIASSGCGPTSMAACLATMLHDKNITPSTMANMMNYDDNIGGNYVAKIAARYGLDQTHTIGLGQDSMNTFLRNGGTMIVAVNNGGHYIAVLGVNDDGTYIVCDPNDFNTANKTWNYNDIATGHTMVFHIAPKGKTVNECLQPHGTAVRV